MKFLHGLHPSFTSELCCKLLLQILLTNLAMSFVRESSISLGEGISEIIVLLRISASWKSGFKGFRNAFEATGQ